ncbi:MAG TPA: hypothetical protein VIJ92_02915 [Ginsengibacter sp.]
MVDANPKQTNKKDKKDFFNLFLEVFGFIRIVVSPFLIGLAIGCGVYVSKPDEIGLVIAISIASIGLIIGIIWATKIWRKKSTLDYISTATSPDFDKFDNDQD